MSKYKCLDCGERIDNNENKHARFKDINGKGIIIGYTCTKCYLNSLPEDSFETYD